MMKYTESHEWVREEGDVATMGITDFAQRELGDVVYVELPELGKSLVAGKEAAVLESTKAAADVYAPLTGEVIAINSRLKEEAELINRSPEGEGWIFKLRISRPEELQALMDQATYLSRTH